MAVLGFSEKQNQQDVVVQSPSHVWHFEIPWTTTLKASLSLTISQRLSKFMSNELVMPHNHLILCCPLLLLLSIFPNIRVFTNESVLCIKWPKYWSFSFSISPSKEYSGLISFTVDWFDLIAYILKKGFIMGIGSRGYWGEEVPQSAICSLEK